MTAPAVSLLLDDETDTDTEVETPEAEAPAVPLKSDGTPWTQEEIDNLHNTLRKVRKEARRAPKAAPEGEGDTAADLESVQREADSKWKPLVVRTAARAAFTEAGLAAADAAAMGRVLKMLDLDDLDVTDDGDVEGLADQVAEIKASFPALFAAAKPARPARVDAAAKGDPPAAPKSSAALLSAMLTGKAA